MDRKYKIPFALTILTFALAGCSTNKIKVEEVKPNPLPKLVQAKTLVPVFSQSVSSTSKADPLRLRLDADNGVIFAVDPNGDWSVVFEGHQHIGAENACRNRFAQAIAQLGQEVFIQGDGDRGFGCPDIRRTIAFFRTRMQGKLAHQQHFAVYIGNRPVHHPLLIIKNAQLADFAT